MNLTGSSEYDILFLMIGILMLAMALNHLQKRVESLYTNHLALSHRLHSQILLKDVRDEELVVE